MQSVLDLYTAACVANADVAMANRRDTAIDAVDCTDGKARRVMGIIGRTSEVGYVVLLLDGRLKATLDFDILNDALAPIPLSIPVPAGSQLTVKAHSTASTGAVTVGLAYEEPD